MRLLTMFFGAFIALCAVAGAVAAADLDRKSPAPAPYSYSADTPAPDYWSGVWIGANVGYGQEHQNFEAIGEGEGGDVSFLEIDGISSIGAVYGVDGGARARLGRFVLGAHLGYELSTIESNFRLGELSASYERGDSWYAGGDAGILIADNVLLYGLVRYVNQAGGEVSAPGIGSFEFDDRDGIGFGGGIEVAAWGPAHIKLEYVHNKFDGETVIQFDGARIERESDEDIVKFGVSYTLGVGSFN